MFSLAAHALLQETNGVRDFDQKASMICDNRQLPCSSHDALRTEVMLHPWLDNRRDNPDMVVRWPVKQHVLWPRAMLGSSFRRFQSLVVFHISWCYYHDCVVELFVPVVFSKIKFAICKTDEGIIPDHETYLHWFKVNKIWQIALIELSLRANTPHKDGC